MTERSGAFWQRHGELMKDPEFADHFKAALAQVEFVDAVVNAQVRTARARALREAAGALDDLQTAEVGLPPAIRRDPALWLYERADSIDKEEA